MRELSLMLQTLEAAIVRCAVGTLGERGFETGAFLADGLLVRPLRADAALDRALTAVGTAVPRAAARRATSRTDGDIPEITKGGSPPYIPRHQIGRFVI